MENQDQFKSFDKIIENLANKKRAKIGFGLIRPDVEIIKSLKRSSKFADIVLVGPAAIKKVGGLRKIIATNPEQKLVEILVSGEVEGIVRGTVDDFKTREAYSKLSEQKLNGDESPALLQDCLNRRFFLNPASNPQGWQKEERLKIAISHAKFCKTWHIKPRIAVFTGVRHETYKRRKDVKDGVVGILNKTYEDAEWLVKKITRAGFEVKNWSIDLDLALESGYNILLPVNGMVGNQILRTTLAFGGKVLFCTYAGIAHFYDDNSRNEKDFDYHIKWLVANINRGK